MPRPQPRETGAPIQWFTAGTPSKKDKGSYARQNEVAYNKAMADIMLQRAQYQSDMGRGAPSYATGRDIPPEEKTPWNQALHDILTKEAEKKAKRDAKKIKESTVKPDKTEHEQTVDLKKQRRDALDAIAQLKGQPTSGQSFLAPTDTPPDSGSGGTATEIPSPSVSPSGSIVTPPAKIEVAGVNKKKKENWFEKYIGGPTADVTNFMGRQTYGDYAGRLLNLAGRPNQAGIGVLSGLWSSDAYGGKPETVAEATKRLGPLSPEQINNVNKIQQQWETIHHDSLWHRAAMGFEGKQQYSLVDQIMAQQIKDKRKYKNPKMGEKIFATSVGELANAVVDPTNVVGFGTVQRGLGAVKGVKEGLEVARPVDEAISGAKIAGHVRELGTGAEAAKELTVGERILGQIPQYSESTRAAQAAEAASRGFEFTDEAQHAARTAEVAQEAKTAQAIADASNDGYKAVQRDARAAARARQNAERLAKVGKVGAEEVAAKVATHEELLQRLNDATEFRNAHELIPVGGELAAQEKRVERLTKLAENAPGNKDLARKLTNATKYLKELRLAKIPETADKIRSGASALATGKHATKAELDALTQAPPQLQDQLLAAAKASEEMPGAAQAQRELTKIQADYLKVQNDATLTPGQRQARLDKLDDAADELVKRGAKKPVPPKKGVKTTDLSAGDAAQLPSSRFLQQIDEAEQKATSFLPSEETMAHAAKIAADPYAPGLDRKIADRILEDAKLHREKLTPATAKSRIAKEMQDLAESDAVKEAAKGRTGEKLAAMRKGGQKLIPSATKDELFNESVLEQILPLEDAVQKLVEEGSRKRFVINFAGKDLGEFKPVGAALTKAYAPFELVGKHIPGGKTFAKAFKMGSHFEGETNYLRQRAENSGTVAHKAWGRRVNELSKQMTPEEAKQITHAIEDDVVLENGRLEGIRQTAKSMIDEIFNEQTRIGKYVPAQRVQNYIYHYYHSHNKDLIKDFKGSRLGDLKSGAKGPTLSVAKAKGLKPEERIDRILMMQHRDFVTDLQRANFRQMVISHFGMLTDNAHFANGLGMAQVTGKKLNRMFQDKAVAQGAAWYLHPDVKKTFDAMDELMGIGHNPKAEHFMRFYDSVVRGYKTSTTIGNIGNWVNNTVGDFFLNYLDGVNSPVWYNKARAALHAEGGKVPKTISMADSPQSTNDLLRWFREKAPSGGFIRNEGTGPIGRLGTHGAKGRVNRITNKVQNAYETREEWVRFAHFLHATDDEARKLISMGKGKTFEDVQDLATELAAKRVSKWNIDYSEITPFERAIRKRYVPFYTFMRKATPLMLEGMITRPGKFNHYTRAQRALEEFMGAPRPEDDGTAWPEWSKEQGITRLSGGNEPNYLRDPTPLNVINRLTGGNTPRAIGMNLLNQSAPPIRFGLEAIQGKTLFNDRPIDQWGQWLLNQVPPVSMGARLAGHPLSPQKTSGSGSGGGTSWLERLSVFGIPIGKMSEARQQAALHEQLHGVSDIYKRMNDALEPYGYSMRHENTEKEGEYWIVRGPDKKVVGRYRNPVDAFNDIQKTPGLQPVSSP